MNKENLVHLKIASVKAKTVDIIAKNMVELNSQIKDQSISTSAVLGAILASTLEHYKKFLGTEETAMMFYHIADDLATKASIQVQFPAKKKKDT